MQFGIYQNLICTKHEYAYYFYILIKMDIILTNQENHALTDSLFKICQHL